MKSVIQTKEDIVKAHGGELKVETKEGEGTVFTIILPMQAKVNPLVKLSTE